MTVQSSERKSEDELVFALLFFQRKSSVSHNDGTDPISAKSPDNTVDGTDTRKMKRLVFVP